MAKSTFNFKRANMFRADPSELVIVGLDTDDGPEHPLYDERINLDLEETMVANIGYHGVLKPIIVRKGADGQAFVVDGRQRVRHARAANKELVAQGAKPILVPIVVERGDDARMLGISISTNEHRQNDGILVKANKAVRLQSMGYDVPEIAREFGVSASTIKNWWSLLEAHPAVVRAVEDGTISPTVGYKLAKLNTEDQRNALDELLAEAKQNGGKVTVTKAKARASGQTGEGSGDGEGSNGSAKPKAPGKALLRKVMEAATVAAAGGEPILSEDAMAILRWATGDLRPKSIKGLQGLIHDATASRQEKAAKNGKKAPPRAGKAA